MSSWGWMKLSQPRWAGMRTESQKEEKKAYTFMNERNTNIEVEQVPGGDKENYIMTNEGFELTI